MQLVFTFFIVSSFSIFATADGAESANPVHGAATTEPAPDIFAGFRETLRGLPDPAIVGLSQRLGESFKTSSRVEPAQFAKMVDGLSGVTDNHKEQLKTRYNEMFPKLGQDASVRVPESVAEIARQRNLSLTTPTTPTAESDAQKRLQERLDRLEKGVEEDEIRDLLNRRAERERNRDRDRGERRGDDRERGSQPSNSSNGADKGSSPSQSEKAKQDDSRHSENKNPKNNNSKNSNSVKIPNLSSDPEPKRGEKESPFGRESEGLASKKPTKPSADSDKKNAEKATDPSESPDSAANSAPKSFNLGMAGESSTPGSIPVSPRGFDFGSDFGSPSSGAVAGAFAAASAGAGASADSGFMSMNLGDGEPDMGGPSGSIAGSFQNGVTWVSGSSPEGDDSGSEFDNSTSDSPSTPSRRAQIYNYGSDIGRLPTTFQEPGIFRTRELLKKKACSRLGC